MVENGPAHKRKVQNFIQRVELPVKEFLIFNNVVEVEFKVFIDNVELVGIHAIFSSIFTGFFCTHTGFFSIFTGFFSTRVWITLERSRLFCGLFATTAHKNYDYPRSKA